MRQQSNLTAFGRKAQTSEERLLRAAAQGRFLDEPPQPAPDAPGYRSGSTGQLVGYAVDEHTATRSTDTGRIQSIDDPQAISRSELKNRYGPPDETQSLRARRPEPAADGPSLFESAVETVASGFGVSPDTLSGPQPVETAGVSDSTYERDMMADKGQRPAGGASRSGVSKGFVDDLATGRDADVSFISAEQERARPSREQFGGDFANAVDEATYGDSSSTTRAEGGFLSSPPELTEGDDPFLVGNPGEFNSPYKSKDKDKYD